MTKLIQLTESQLEAKATEIGAAFAPGALSKKQLIDLIENFVPGEVEEPEVEEPEPEVVEDPSRKWRYKIVVHNQDGVENTPFIKVGVNGRFIQIMREQECVIDSDYMHALNNAVIEMPAHGDQPARKTARFPVSVLEVIK